MRAPQAGEKKPDESQCPSCPAGNIPSLSPAHPTGLPTIYLQIRVCVSFLPLLGCRGVYEQSHCCFPFPPATPGRGQTEFEWEMCWLGERGRGTQHLHHSPPPPSLSVALGPSTQRGFCRLTARCWLALHVQSAKPPRLVTSQLCEDGPLLPQTAQFWFGSSWG